MGIIVLLALVTTFGPFVMAQIGDRIYEDAKEEAGYKNIGKDKSLFRDIKFSRKITKKLLEFSLFVPGINFVVMDFILRRRTNGVTLDAEIANGDIVKTDLSNSEDVIKINDSDIEVLDASDLEYKKEFDEGDLKNFMSELNGEELTEMAEIFSDMLFADVIASALFGSSMEEEQTGSYGEFTDPRMSEIMDIINGIDESMAEVEEAGTRSSEKQLKK